MPYFKKKDFVEKSVNSVLSQTYKNFEIIIIYDDKNFDDINFIKKIKKKDSRIKIVINKKRLGAGMSRNIGIILSKSKYIAFLDCDDVWKKEKLKNQINFMEKYNYNITHTSYEIINEDNNVIGKRIAKSKITFQDLIKSCNIGLSTVILKKSILKNINFPNLKTKEDYVLWLRLAKNDYKFYGINQFLTKWRKINNSLSSSVFQKMADGFRVYNYYMKYNFTKSVFCLARLSINYLLKK